MKTTIEVKKQTATRIQIVKQNLGLANADEVINLALESLALSVPEKQEVKNVA